MRTITFYSYKGGTGRTLAVANTARFLAEVGHHVVVMDLDLEAPGLHFKFSLRIPEHDMPIVGVVDMIDSFSKTSVIPEIDPFLFHVDLPESVRGSIRLLPAGNAPSSDYLQRLAAIRDGNFFDPSEGRFPGTPDAWPFFIELQERIKATSGKPDYLLIDSRTGVPEIGGLALGIMPDTIVCLTHNNEENISGTRRILQAMQSAPTVPGAEPTKIVAVLARIPEMPRTQEEEVLAKALASLNRITAGSTQTLGLPEILMLRSDPSLQIFEDFVVGSERTPNESVLLRDYYKLFEKLGFDERLEHSEKQVLKLLANGDQRSGVRRLLTATRWEEGESMLSPINILDRLRKRKPATLKVVTQTYATGNSYGHFIRGVLDRLQQAAEITSRDPIPDEDVRWDLLPVHLREGVLDFCADIYYLTENRAHLVDIVQLGWCQTFTVFVQDGTEASRFLKEPSIGTSSRDFQRCVVELIQKVPETAVGVLGETPAASEANRQLASHLRACHLISKGSEDDLIAWLVEDNHDGRKVIICDHVIGDKLSHLSHSATSFPAYSIGATFQFARPIPLGIVYPREDSAWRREIARAIAGSLLSFLRTDSWDIATASSSVANDFTATHTEALCLKDLRASLLFDLTFAEATEWSFEMEKSMKNTKCN